MAVEKNELLLQVLRTCAQMAPEPLYPSVFAREADLDRTQLDQTLDELRTRGLVQLTDWMPDRGQGYVVTPLGQEALERGVDPREQPRVPTTPVAADTRPEPDEDRFQQVFINPGSPVVTWTLIAANVVIFFIGMFHAQRAYNTPVPGYLNASHRGVSLTMLEFGVLHPQLVLEQQQWWRLIASAFLHFGIIHLLANMYFLYVLGPGIEAMWGSGRFLVLYLGSAVTASCMVLWIEREALTAGASGALCGLAASMAVWLYLNRDALPPMVFASLSRMITINLILLTIISVVFRNISWEGHLGGAIGGAIIAFPLQAARFGDTSMSRILGLLGAVLVPLLFFLATMYRGQLFG